MYEQLRTELDAKIQEGEKLTQPDEQQNFVTDTFVWIYTEHVQKHIRIEEYVQLTKRLGAYQNGDYNDYLDLLAGAAVAGMLDIAVAQSRHQDLAGLARQRSETVTKLTGLRPVKPDRSKRR